MFVSLDNDPRPYDWGSMTDIAELLGRKPSGRPEAELWLGDHPGCPARIVNPAAVGGHRTLADWTTAEPEAALGTASGGRLPFLLKVLAAATPLSLQVHPTIEQAQAGFEQEDNAGISFDAPHRNYRDANHKPELIVALSDSFEALCGFRAIEESREIAARLVELARDTGVSRTGLSELASLLKSSESPEAAVKWLLGENPVVAELTALVESGLVPSGLPDHPEVLPLVARLALQYPEDPGIAVALLAQPGYDPTWRRALPAGRQHPRVPGWPRDRAYVCVG
ncbi:mannose-6-phosphate isomerase, class I [Arthrobacter sp. SD76]|uniref:mannose-6-phosphate isomerase, class I n=1 Tax=Arthrobacter sp. SD76 TaxID=3415007 RepID=UPI003C767F2C